MKEERQYIFVMMSMKDYYHRRPRLMNEQLVQLSYQKARDNALRNGEDVSGLPKRLKLIMGDEI